MYYKFIFVNILCEFKINRGQQRLLCKFCIYYFKQFLLIYYQNVPSKYIYTMLTDVMTQNKMLKSGNFFNRKSSDIK